jgi:hypothetical protein
MLLSKREQRLAANNVDSCIWKEIAYAFAKTGSLGTV